MRTRNDIGFPTRKNLHMCIQRSLLKTAALEYLKWKLWFSSFTGYCNGCSLLNTLLCTTNLVNETLVKTIVIRRYYSANNMSSI